MLKQLLFKEERMERLAGLVLHRARVFLSSFDPSVLFRTVSKNSVRACLKAGVTKLARIAGWERHTLTSVHVPTNKHPYRQSRGRTDAGAGSSSVCVRGKKEKKCSVFPPEHDLYLRPIM